MIERIEDLPAGVLGFEGKGKVTGEGYETSRQMIRGVGFLIPAEARVVATAELEAAKQWVAGSR